MEFTSALLFLTGMFSHSSSNAVCSCPRVFGVFRRLLTRLSSSSHKCSIGDKSALTVVSRVVQCCCLLESLGKLCLHGDGHYHAGKSFNAVALTELPQDEGSHLCIVPLLGSREQQSIATSHHAKSLPYHNRPSPISIPLENASVGKPFLTTSVQTTSPVSTKRVNRDSSVKKTRLHCLIGKRLGACAVTKAIRRARRARLSGKPTLGGRARRPNSRNRFLTVFG